MNVYEKAVSLARENGLDLVIASTTGSAAMKLLDERDKQGFGGKVVVVRNVAGSFANGSTGMSEEAYDALVKRGACVVTAGHALSGAERGISKRFGGVSPVEVMAETLRMFGQGTKVCVEIAIMANDAGHFTPGKPVVAVAGSGRGANTICIIAPGYSATIFDTKIIDLMKF